MPKKTVSSEKLFTIKLNEHLAHQLKDAADVLNVSIETEVLRRLHLTFDAASANVTQAWSQTSDLLTARSQMILAKEKKK